jgi:hypothetical protein
MDYKGEMGAIFWELQNAREVDLDPVVLIPGCIERYRSSRSHFDERDFVIARCGNESDDFEMTESPY